LPNEAISSNEKEIASCLAMTQHFFYWGKNECSNLQIIKEIKSIRKGLDGIMDSTNYLNSQLN